MREKRGAGKEAEAKAKAKEDERRRLTDTFQRYEIEIAAACKRPIIFFEKFGHNKKSAYLCSPFAKKAGVVKKKRKNRINVTCH